MKKTEKNMIIKQVKHKLTCNDKLSIIRECNGRDIDLVMLDSLNVIENKGYDFILEFIKKHENVTTTTNKEAILKAVKLLFEGVYNIKSIN